MILYNYWYCIIIDIENNKCILCNYWYRIIINIVLLLILYNYWCCIIIDIVECLGSPFLQHIVEGLLFFRRRADCLPCWTRTFSRQWEELLLLLCPLPQTKQLKRTNNKTHNNNKTHKTTPNTKQHKPNKHN